MARTKSNKKTEKDYVAFIQQCITKYQGPLLLTTHTIVIRKNTEHYYLACKYRYPYNDGIVIYSDASFRDWLDEPVSYHERKILHELCHLITDPLYSKATTQFVSKTEVEDEREKLTDHLAVMVHKLMGEQCQ
jgi:hypothetical protein